MRGRGRGLGTLALLVALGCAHRPSPPPPAPLDGGEVVEGAPDPERMPPEDALARAAALVDEGAPEEALALLTRLTKRPDLPEPLRVRALVERGVLELRAAPELALTTLRDATSRLRALGDDERIAPSVAAHAWFYQGEAVRARLADRPIDPALPADALTAALSWRSEELLEAQDAYLRAGKAGDPEVTVAAGTRIGELYEGFRAELLAAPLPPSLPPGQEATYRTELRERLRPLAQKAADAYEATLAGARERGLTGPWVDEVEAALLRVREELRADRARP